MSEHTQDNTGDALPEKVHVPCPLCGADKPVPFGTEHGFNCVTCANCSLTYVTPRLSHESLVDIYTNFYHRQNHWKDYLEKSGSQKEAGTKKPENPSQLWPSRLDSIWPYFAKTLGDANGKRVLDAGAGTSIWAEFIANKGAESWAFDIAGNALQQEQSGPDSPVTWKIAPSIPEAELPPESFDMVTLWDVIEHYENPAEELSAICGLLKPGGVIFIQTPNAWWVRLKYRLSKILPRSLVKALVSEHGILMPQQHLQYYSVKTLCEQLKKCGFTFTGSANIDWGEPGSGMASKILYPLIYWQSAITDTLSGGNACTNIGLSMFARKG